MSEIIDNIDIVKVGTNVLVGKRADGSEHFKAGVMNDIGRQALGDNNVVIVSSGAITAGMMRTGMKKRPDKQDHMADLQRLASIGGPNLIAAWKQAIEWPSLGIGKFVGEVLLTKQELIGRGHREEREEALTVIHNMLSNRTVPVVNENDVIAHEEIAYGDNDTLAATLAARMAKDRKRFGKRIRLFLLSDVNGVYEDRQDSSSRIPVIADVALYRHLAEETDKENATGGMRTKFEAADIAKDAGLDMWIYNPADGHRERAVRMEIGTYFPASVR
jgi:glutamate 5-kinase